MAQDLRVAGANGDADVTRGLREARNDPVECLDLEAFLDERIEPMSPPGNSSGCTVKPSVVIMTSPPSRSMGTASAVTSIVDAPRCRTNTDSISSRMKRPPLPWASEICVSSICAIPLIACGELNGLTIAQAPVVARQRTGQLYLEA